MPPHSAPPAPWPYPRWIAHRGAGKLAPENTLAAFRLGAQHRYRMAECDVKLSADGVPFLLHDATLERTTNAHGAADALPWAELATLDAGRWHSGAYAGEPLLTLDALAAWCLEHDQLLNIEIKPVPGTESHTGRVVAQHAARLWAGAATPPLLSSFQPAALAAARDTAPELPRALLLDALPPGWLALARELGCDAVVCHHPLWTAATATQALAAGLQLLAYTVNDPTEADRLWDLGLDGLITDRIDLFNPAH